MPSFTTSLTTFVALLGVVQTTPVSLEKRKSFSVELVSRRQYLKNGAASKAKALAKYGKPVPDNIVKAAAAGPSGSKSGSVTATPGDSYDSEYLAPVTTGGNSLHLDFDTGSADLWVYSNLQPSSQTSGHDIYQTNNNKVVSGATWQITYGDGSGAAGKVYADTVVVGGVTATSQAVEAATSVSSQFLQDTASDGLLGLAFSSINTVKPNQAKTFFDTVKPNLASPIFTATLKYHTAGTYDFGYIDNSKYTGAITYVNVNTGRGFWEFTASGFVVGSSSNSIQTQSIDAIADTGTTLIYLPTTVVQAYYAKVSGAQNSDNYGGWVFPCSTTLQDFTVIIGGSRQTVPAKYINYAPVASGSSTCFGGIQDGSGIGFSILGDIFLKSKYVVFENSGSTPRIGFAQQAGV